MNIALMLKWIWKTYQDAAGLWADLLRAKYLGYKDIFFPAVPCHGSQFWNALQKNKMVLQARREASRAQWKPFICICNTRKEVGWQGVAATHFKEHYKNAPHTRRFFWTARAKSTCKSFFTQRVKYRGGYQGSSRYRHKSVSW
jgi:hypothetical protein